MGILPLAVGALALGHSNGWPQLPLGPLGVPGFPDCVAPAGADVSGPNVSDAELEVRGRALICNPKAKQAGQISIACVGDSITAGVHSSNSTMTYPAQLQRLLNAKYPGKYVVTNYGACGSTMQKAANSPYWDRPQYPAVMGSDADIVTIMLGTNDAKDTGDHGPANWENDGKTGTAEFKTDYHTMITKFLSFDSKPQVYVMIPPPLYKAGVYGMNQTVINKQFPTLIPEIGKANGLTTAPIDVFDALGGAKLAHPEWSADGCHPNDDGYAQLAAAVMKGLGL
eukprot:Hpha_TRINITY_DN36222_c0_g1::TRINITY_DN36222_c0_g1_i1::g.83299::m.83299